MITSKTFLRYKSLNNVDFIYIYYDLETVFYIVHIATLQHFFFLSCFSEGSKWQAQANNMHKESKILQGTSS
jgi:hypothetical protein